MRKITLFFTMLLAISISWQTNAQADCASAIDLTPGTSQVGDTTGNSPGSFSDTNTAPEVNPCSSNYNDLEYWFKYTAVTTGDTLDITVSDLTSNYYGVFIIDNCPDSTPTCIAQDTNGPSSVDLTVTSPSLTAGTTYYIVLSDWIEGSTTFTLNSTVIAASTCPDPNTLAAAPSSTTETTISWAVGGTETNWTYEYGAVGYTQGTETLVPTTSMSAVLSGLTPGNEYDFYVQANCGGGDGDSVWSGPFTWTQPFMGESCVIAFSATLEADCASATPTTLDFDTGGSETLTSCDGAGNTGYWIKTTTSTTGALKIFTSGTATDLGLSIYDACAGSEVYCNNNTLPAELSLSGFNPSSEYFFYFWQDTASGFADVCFEEISCLFPVDLAAVVTTTTDSDISWTPGNSPSAGAWEYVVQASGTGEPVGGGTATTTSTVTVTGTSGTEYEFYVRADCGGGSYSAWSGPFTWTQALPPANDDCANATAVTALPFNETIDASAATNNAGFITDCNALSGYGMNDGVWYTFTVATSGTIDIAISGVDASFDPKLDLYSGSCGTFTCETASDIGGNGTDESISGHAVVAGIQYFINIGNWSGTSDNPEGPFTIDISTVDTTVLPVEDSFIDGFSIFPNPVNDILRFNAQDDIKSISIYNLLGQEVLARAPNAVQSEVSMSNLPTGIYIVKVKVGEQLGTYKIIKE